MPKKQIIQLSAVSFLLLAFFLGWYYWRHPLGAKAIINGHTIKLELAVTSHEKEIGLGYRDSLPQDTGMLFVYGHKEIFPYWMRGMRFPLDIVWIADNTVVDIDVNVLVEQTDDVNKLTVYHPSVAVDKVLELNAGKAAELNIKAGDTVEFKQ